MPMCLQGLGMYISPPCCLLVGPSASGQKFRTTFSHLERQFRAGASGLLLEITLPYIFFNECINVLSRCSRKINLGMRPHDVSTQMRLNFCQALLVLEHRCNGDIGANIFEMNFCSCALMILVSTTKQIGFTSTMYQFWDRQFVKQKYGVWVPTLKSLTIYWKEKSQYIMMANNKKIIISTFLSTSQYLSFLICKTE